jgi:glucan phosphoethanolaminetransferase (alkaline phosphatase superfamily)
MRQATLIELSHTVILRRSPYLDKVFATTATTAINAVHTAIFSVFFRFGLFLQVRGWNDVEFDTRTLKCFRLSVENGLEFGHTFFLSLLSLLPLLSLLSLLSLLCLQLLLLIATIFTTITTLTIFTILSIVTMIVTMTKSPALRRGGECTHRVLQRGSSAR